MHLKYGTTEISMWEGKHKKQDAMFVDSGPEKWMKMRYLDIPLLHLNSMEGMEFIKALDCSDDLSLFTALTTQAIVNYHWRSVRFWLWGLIMIPYFVQLSVFSYWSNVVLVDTSSRG